MSVKSDVQRVKKEKKQNSSGIPKVHNYIQDEPSALNPPEGERISVCEVCGEPFEQAYIPSSNRFSSFKKCPSCRQTKGKKIMKSVSVVEYQPFPWQVEAEKQLDSHRYLVLACGARTGKDRFSNMQVLRYTADLINENRQVNNPDLTPSFLIWIIAPTFPMAKQNFRELKKYLPKEWVRKIRESDMTFEIINGGIIEVKSAYDEENLVGVGLDFCTITEADRVKNLEAVWANISMRLVSPGRGREKDRIEPHAGCGKCIINSSPTGKGFFYEMWRWGQPGNPDYDPDFTSINLPSWANPYVKEELERVKHTKYGNITNLEFKRRQMSPERFARDIEGKFVDNTGTVFNDFRKKCVVDAYGMGISDDERERLIKEWKMYIPGHIYRIGYDPATGSSSDDPAVVVRDVTVNRIVAIRSLYGKNYDQQYDEIAYLSRRYGFAPCCWLRTGHTAIENQLAKRGVVEIPLNEQGGKKAEYIQSLERAVQNEDLQVLDDGEQETEKLINQMDDYTEKDGKYSNSLQPHDDFVSALYAAYYDYSVSSEEIVGFSALLSKF